MNQKKLMRILIIVIAAMLLGALASERAALPRKSDDLTGLIRDCPEHWYINHMPMMMDAPDAPRTVSDEYFVYKGMRRELMEFDMPWMERYCSQTPEYLY
ncbi:MAG: hypothetical protein HYT41_02405 [Candidatus Sungbacteria bacterium]|nr:hypothetical protein [Candidatus Sungbacteria bacterium]